MWTSVVVPMTLGLAGGVGGGGGWQCVTSLTLSIPLSILSALSPKYSTLSIEVQAGWTEASFGQANY